MDPLIIDIDASLVHVHSDKEHAAGTYKRGYCSAPVIASVDYGKDNGTGEILAVRLRPGNKGANSATDHITILDQALARLPHEFYDQDEVLIGEEILVRTDSADASREFLRHLDSLGVQLSTSYALPVVNERFIGWINEKKYWELATDQHGHPGCVGDRCEPVIGLNNYPQGTRIYARAEPLHPGAKAPLFDTDGNRVPAFLTNAPRYNVAFLDARHRARGRCENRIKTLKSMGLGKLSYWSFAANQAWVNLAVLAMNLTSWIQLALLPVNHPAGCWDVKRWRYRLYSSAGKPITSSRQTRLLIPETVPEATLLMELLGRAQAGYQQWRHGHLTA